MFGKVDLVLANLRDIWKTILSYSVKWAESQAYPSLGVWKNWNLAYQGLIQYQTCFLNTKIAYVLWEYSWHAQKLLSNLDAQDIKGSHPLTWEKVRGPFPHPDVKDWTEASRLCVCS